MVGYSNARGFLGKGATANGHRWENQQRRKQYKGKTVIIQVKREYHLIINLSGEMDLKIFEADQSQLRGCG